MLKPLQEWICDHCGKVIESSREGYVLWRADENNKNFDFKIIHHSVCDDSRFPASLPLDNFLGVKGLANLTSFLSLGKVMVNLGRSSFCSVKDMDEFVDFFRRVQVPFYEEARLKFDNPEFLEDMSDANEVYPYQEHVLKNSIELKQE